MAKTISTGTPGDRATSCVQQALAYLSEAQDHLTSVSGEATEQWKITLDSAMARTLRLLQFLEGSAVDNKP